MPLFPDDTATRSPRIVVSGSIAVELDWALAAVQRPEFQRDHPVLERVYGTSPQLVERARSFWGPAEQTSCGGIELMILANQAGLLFSVEADEFLGQLEQACATAPVALRLASETAADRAAVLARLARLRSSPEVRRQYVALVNDVWSALAPGWERDGRRAVSVAVAARDELRRQGASWREVVGDLHSCNHELVKELVTSLRPDEALAVVPGYFAHLGSFVDLPGIVLLGVRAEVSGAQARARTELLARRLKTISDPTRLAMLEVVRVSPLTVSELAAHFLLAQPTVSNHVKMLREAGILSHRNDGGRRVLTVQPEVLADLLGHLEEMFVVPSRRPAP